MRIGVIHDSLNYVGGAERVCLKTIEALKEAGHYVTLGTIEKTDWKRVTHILGPSQMPDKQVSLMARGLTSLRFYASLLSPLVLSSIKDQCDSTICTDEDLVLLRTDFGYMHYIPSCLVQNHRDLPPNPPWTYTPSL